MRPVRILQRVHVYGLKTGAISEIMSSSPQRVTKSEHNCVLIKTNWINGCETQRKDENRKQRVERRKREKEEGDKKVTEEKKGKNPKRVTKIY